MSMTIESLELRQLLAAPELDLTFGEGGLARVPNAPYGHVFAVNQLDNGKVVAAGTTPSFSTPFVARFNANGTLDTTCDSDGVMNLNPVGGGFSNADDGAITPDGKILILWRNNGVVVLRFNPHGTPDSAFGTNGR